MNREQLNKIKDLLSFGDIIAKEEDKYNLTNKAVIKLINEIERLRIALTEIRNIKMQYK